MDFELSQQVDKDTFQQQLSSQLPVDIPIYSVADVDLAAPTQLLKRAEYLITVATLEGASVTHRRNGWMRFKPRMLFVRADY